MRLYYERRAAGLCPQCGKRPAVEGKAWCAECREALSQRNRHKPPEQARRWDKTFRLNLLAKTVEAYGGRCACCGEGYLPYLTIDHVNGGGLKHRDDLKAHGTVFYQRLKMMGYPKDGLQVLCANCHMAKTRGVVCQHS